MTSPRNSAMPGGCGSARLRCDAWMAGVRCVEEAGHHAAHRHPAAGRWEASPPDTRERLNAL